jgi:hypothetical protein
MIPPLNRSRQVCKASTKVIFPRATAICAASPLPFLLVKTQTQPSKADTVSFERFPNQLAAQTDSRIIVARLNVADEVHHGRFLPTQLCIIWRIGLHADSIKNAIFEM